MMGDWRAFIGEVGSWSKSGYVARATLGWKPQSGRPKRMEFGIHTRSMSTARAGANALAG